MDGIHVPITDTADVSCAAAAQPHDQINALMNPVSLNQSVSHNKSVLELDKVQAATIKLCEATEKAIEANDKASLAIQPHKRARSFDSPLQRYEQRSNPVRSPSKAELKHLLAMQEISHSDDLHNQSVSFRTAAQNEKR